MKKFKYIIGIDEVGRGPLAGPVAVGAVCIPNVFDRKFFAGIKDSKKLTKESREMWFTKIKKMAKEVKLSYAVSFVSSEKIDAWGLTRAINTALQRSIRKLDVDPLECLVLLDGGLKAPAVFKNQQTIIKGDEKEPVISAASIMAKVLRDRKMIAFARKYPGYGFEIHKGYGTQKHLANIKKSGMCPIHRRSFLKSIVDFKKE